MARKRAYKKRMDYRKGGRVTYQRGGMYDTEGMFAEQEAAAAERAAAKAAPPAPAPTTPTFTQAQIDEAVAGLNAGTMTPAQVAQQYGVTEDFVTSNLASINAQRAASGQVQPDPVTPASVPNIYTPPADLVVGPGSVPTFTPAMMGGAGIGINPELNTGGDTLPDDNVDTGIGGGTPPVVIPPPQDPIVTPPGGTPTPPGGTPTPPGGTPTPPPAPPSSEDIAAIPADADYTQFEINQVIDALNAGTMTPEEVAAQFGVTPAQVRAELARQNQFRAGEAVTGEDPFADGLPNVAQQQAAVATGQGVTFKDKAGKEDYVPGSFLKQYKPFDIGTLQKQTAAQIDLTGTITPETAIEQLDSFSGIDKSDIDTVTANAITTASAAVKSAIQSGDIAPSNYEAALAGELSRTIPAFAGAPAKAVVDEIRALTAPAQAAQISMQQAQAARASGVDYVISPNSFVPEVVGTQATLSETPQAEAASRAAITGAAATGQEAQIIDQIGYAARQRSAVTGEAAKGAAANVIAVTAELPQDLAANIVEDPATVAAVVDTQPIEVQAAIAALPEEALVSAQLENLLGGMESGNIPTWARPAVSAVEQNLAARGMSISTVGRDALFNAIIQTAVPIAQSNATALQNNAAQNLTNQQQANLESARLNSTRKLANLSNQQTAAAQTAQFAQNLKVLQSQQAQETALISAQQQQQVRLQNLQNRQRATELTAQNQQQLNAQELGNAQQIELANLEILNQTEQQNMTAENQQRLAEMQIGAQFLAKNADLKQQMELANLSSEQQMRLANLTAQNQADAQSLTAAQQTELANLNATMTSNINNARLAQQMNVAQLSVDQQRAMTNAATQARIDLTKFTTAQQVELANSQFMQSTTITNMNARQQAAMQNATAMASMDLATADQRTKLAIENARNFLQIDVANLNNEQQAVVLDQQMRQQSLLSNQAADNAARQFSATSENQINMFLTTQKDAIAQFNAAQNNAMAQFNASEENRIAAIEAGNELEASKINAQIQFQIEQFNEKIGNDRDIWNAANSQAVEQANTNWRRQSNTANTAAINAANAQNVQNAYGITTQELDFVWQSLRDEATFLRKEQLDLANQKTNLYITAMQNETNTAINTTGVSAGVSNLINTMFE
jgi:hypothetical protein